MNKTIKIAIAVIIACNGLQAQTMIDKNNISLSSNRMTPEALWAMGRIGGAQASPDGKTIVYQVGYYSVKENKGRQVLYTSTSDGKKLTKLTTENKSQTDASWIENGKRIAFLQDGQLWAMNADGNEKKQLTKSSKDIEGFKFSPDGKRVILIKSISYHESIKENPKDLPLATGRLVTDLNYRHWDHYVESIPHPYVANILSDGVIDEGIDIMNGEPYECPMAPFGGIEQLCWSPDSKKIAYTCRKKTGVNYAISTDSDIYLYDTETNTTTNLCKPESYKPVAVDPTKTMKFQAINNQTGDFNMGYDVNPKFSPDGKYIAWQSMARDGYESDRNRLCIYTLSDNTKRYVTEQFDSNVDDYCWSKDSRTLYFTGCWHARINLYQTDLNGNVKQLTDDVADFGSISMANNGNKILATRHSMSQADELYIITPGKDIKKTEIKQITFENKHIYDQLTMGEVREQWIKTTDGKDMLCWIILPPDFDASKKYPTLLYCEGGPQSPVSQFWSFRWNFQIMAAHGYVIIAPNRRGLPGFGP